MEFDIEFYRRALVLPSDCHVEFAKGGILMINGIGFHKSEISEMMFVNTKVLEKLFMALSRWNIDDFFIEKSLSGSGIYIENKFIPSLSLLELAKKESLIDLHVNDNGKQKKEIER